MLSIVHSLSHVARRFRLILAALVAAWALALLGADVAAAGTYGYQAG